MENDEAAQNVIIPCYFLQSVPQIPQTNSPLNLWFTERSMGFLDHSANSMRKWGITANYTRGQPRFTSCLSCKPMVTFPRYLRRIPLRRYTFRRHGLNFPKWVFQIPCVALQEGDHPEHPCFLRGHSKLCPATEQVLREGTGMPSIPFYKLSTIVLPCTRQLPKNGKERKKVGGIIAPAPLH